MHLRRVEVTRIDPAAAETRRTRDDELIVEEPLAIRVGGEALAVTMRTPGADAELVMGFLWAEGVIRSRDDVSSITRCARPEDPTRDNTVEVTLAPGVRSPLDDVDAPLFARRGTITSSACGVCGRRSIDDLLTSFRPVAPGPGVSRAVISAAVRDLHERQPMFARTGGCHAASLRTVSGEHVVTFEDVGRHNAVDKVVGARLRADALPLAGHLLVVSGRSSFEIVQKALAAAIPVVVSVSAASSLAVDLARRGNVTLIGFARGDAMTVYAGAERVI